MFGQFITNEYIKNTLGFKFLYRGGEAGGDIFRGGGGFFEEGRGIFWRGEGDILMRGGGYFKEESGIFWGGEGDILRRGGIRTNEWITSGRK